MGNVEDWFCHLARFWSISEEPYARAVSRNVALKCCRHALDAIRPNFSESVEAALDLAESLPGLRELLAQGIRLDAIPDELAKSIESLLESITEGHEARFLSEPSWIGSAACLLLDAAAYDKTGVLAILECATGLSNSDENKREEILQHWFDMLMRDLAANAKSRGA